MMREGMVKLLSTSGILMFQIAKIEQRSLIDAWLATNFHRMYTSLFHNMFPELAVLCEIL